MNVLLMAYIFDRDDVGETLVAFHWAKALSERVNLTLLSLQRPMATSLEEQLPAAEVVVWPEPAFVRLHERFNAMAKPAYPLLYRNVRRWVRTELAKGRRFDIAHQLMPLAARYPCPFYGLGVPYLIGPLGGSLSTPEGFRDEVATASWYTKFRSLDAWRLRHDPWLRRGYSNADVILGVAPYVERSFSSIPIKRFEPMLELGIDALAPPVKRPVGSGLKLLHVGRGVRTKGLRDTVRAMARLSDLADITLTSAGGGEEVEHAGVEAQSLGVTDRVTFLGKVPHKRVEELYKSSDVFVFPSFREPTGGVLYEAMRWGMPVITVDYGGPAHIVDESCGIRLPVTTPEALCQGIADTVRTLYHDPKRLRALSRGSQQKLAREGLWPNKAKRMIALYEEIIEEPRAPIGTGTT